MYSKTIRITAVLGAVAVLAGCGTITQQCAPGVKCLEAPSQYKVSSAGHWDVISKDIISSTLNNLQEAGVTQGTPIYVATPEGASRFDLAFRDFLTTRLVEAGASVHLQPAPGQFTVVYHTQVVRHPSNSGVKAGGQSGDYYYLGEGVAVRRNQHNIMTEDYTGNHAGSTGGFGRVPGTEMILTTSVINGEKFISRKTDVYYVENVDATLFQNSFKNINLKVVNQ